MYRLIVLSGPMTGRRFTIEKAPMTIGRAGTCAICLPDEEAALEHAIIEHRSDGLFISDQGSMSKLLVNGLQVHKARLKHGDEVEIGRTRFLIQAFLEADVARPPRARNTRRKTLYVFLLLGAAVATALFVQLRKPEKLGVVEPATLPDTDAEKGLRVESAEPHSPASEQGSFSPIPTVEEEAGEAVIQALTTPEVSPESAPSSSADLSPSLPTPVLPPEQPPSSEAVTESPATAEQDALAVVATNASQPTERVAESQEVLGGVVAPEPLAPRTDAPPTDLRIVTLDQQKFPETEDIAEMRVVSVQIAASGTEMPTEGSVSVEFLFFERDTRTSAIAPAPTLVLQAPVFPDGPWKPHEPKLVTATYILPRPRDKNYDSRQQRDKTFHGYVVRVLHKGALQDIEARPKELLALALPAIRQRRSDTACPIDTSPTQVLSACEGRGPNAISGEDTF
ncbi:MAG: FHA domain-containing protein [Kiritimatiellia bacterium]